MDKSTKNSADNTSITIKVTLGPKVYVSNDPSLTH